MPYYDEADNPADLRYLFDDGEDQNLKECLNCPSKVPQDTLIACIECGAIVCPDCTKRFGMLDLCLGCAVCKVCRVEALLWCESCGDILCPDHARTYNEYDPETGYRESETVCAGGCKKEPWRGII